MTAPELKSFHLGIVVRDLEQTVSQYSAMFDIDRWHQSPGRFNGLLMAYGMGPGISIELFEITAPGDSHIHQHWDQRGEGVHHVGIWADDMASAVRKATNAGAELVSISADADGNATAQLIPSSAVTEDQLAHLGLVSFVSSRGGVMFEYVGRAGEEFMRDWFKDNYDHVVMGAPWSS